MALAFGLVGARLARAPPISGVLAGTAVMLLLAMLPDTEVHLASGMETLLFTALHAFAAAWAAFVVFDPDMRIDASKTAGGIATLVLLVLVRPEGGVLALGYLLAVVVARSNTRAEIVVQLRALMPVWSAVLIASRGGFWNQIFGDVFPNATTSRRTTRSSARRRAAAGAPRPRARLAHAWRPGFRCRGARGARALRELLAKGAAGARSVAAIVLLYARRSPDSRRSALRYPLLAPLIGTVVAAYMLPRRLGFRMA
jgi:hypothetical protein